VGTRIGNDQVKDPVEPELPHVDDGARLVAPQSPDEPDAPAVIATDPPPPLPFCERVDVE
jgi:hypothetical protein